MTPVSLGFLGERTNSLCDIDFWDSDCLESLRKKNEEPLKAVNNGCPTKLILSPHQSGRAIVEYMHSTVDY